MQDLNRVRYVTQNYTNLQGLRWIIWGLLCLLVAAEDGGWLPALILFLLVVPVAFILFMWSGYYYSQNYGRVEAPEKEHIELLRFAVLFATALASLLIDRTLQPPISIALLVLAGGLFIIHRQVGRPYRWHYLALALLVLAASLALTWLNLPADSPFSRDGVVVWTAVGFSLLVGGAIDHFVLAQTLRPVE